MIYTWLLAILFIAACCYFIYKQKKIHKTYTRLIERKNEEAAGALALKEELQKEQTEALLTDERRHYEEAINDVIEQRNSDVSKLNHYIRMIERFSRNSGEIMTHNILLELKSELIKAGMIRTEEMRVLGNVFIPYYSESGDLQTRQIDHLIILPTGIYVVETKYWKGKVLHGLTKEKAREFSFIMESLFPKSGKDEEETIAFINTNNSGQDHKAEMKVVAYDNPAMQAKNSVQFLKNYLINKEMLADAIVPIVYFGYKSNEQNTIVDYSQDAITKRFISKTELHQYFNSEINDKRKIYNITEIQELKALIEDANVLQ